MNRSHLPLAGLRAFEAAARHLSVTKAASELCVTPGAVSQQVKSLEDVLGVALIQRKGRTIELTDAGQVLRPQVTQALDMISLACDAITRQPKSRTLRLTLLPTLAEKWLMPRLARFHGAHPELDIQMMTSFRPVQFDSDEVDMASYVGTHLPPGISGIRLFDDAFLPVCSPKLLENRPPLENPADVLQFTLLHSVSRADDWHQWLSLAGLPDARPAHNLSFGNSSLSIRAALDGMGVAMVQRVYAKANLADGSLVAPFALTASSSKGYFFGWPTNQPMGPAFELFRAWLLEEVAADQA